MPSGEKTPKQIPPAMEANKWKPGQSGNPTGRPRKLPITERYEALAEVRLSKEARDKLRLPAELKRTIKTYGDLLALGQFQSAIKGKTEAAREIADRLEGRARQPVEVSGGNGGPIQYAEIVARIRKRKAQSE